jgi:hypothetical protein
MSQDIDLTPTRPGIPTAQRDCLVCRQPIVELKKAAWLPMGSGIRLVLHPECADSLIEKHEYAARKEVVELLTPKQKADVVIDLLNQTDELSETAQRESNDRAYIRTLQTRLEEVQRENDELRRGKR